MILRVHRSHSKAHLIYVNQFIMDLKKRHPIKPWNHYIILEQNQAGVPRNGISVKTLIDIILLSIVLKPLHRH